jgi:hypothetical protein
MPACAVLGSKQTAACPFVGTQSLEDPKPTAACAVFGIQKKHLSAVVYPY